MTELKPKKGNLLVAEPSIIGDISFHRSVVLLADHNETGSVGFILNKTLDFQLDELLPELNIASSFPVYNGGPVEQDNLYFIHKIPELIPDSIEITNGIFWGGNFDAVKELIEKGLISQKDIKFFLGYSGWDFLQLDTELEAKAWIIIENYRQEEVLKNNQSSFWKEKLEELGGQYLIWSNAPENPSYN
ncbi:YqgE/AlgH family protein [Mesonia sp. K7]|uniref:YqgE/AlgH family protein n=1 Tax=Mesonia sp. K7 TaxID=2218606 RepID=UPI000DA72086|nr:YqgE/AlgH family protein [Mesonia sp. K7]PZD78220.1 YqgE/AlgH family protein [Mesonia sp. K7]